MEIPFLDLRPAYLEIKEKIDSAVHRVLESGWYVLSDEVEAFEEEFAAYCDAKYAVGLASGLDALHLALRAMDVGPGDEVIVPSNTYIATWLGVTQSGATVVPVEPDPFTHNIDPSRIEAAITARTKVILPVHFYGLPADMSAILEIAKKHALLVLEDAAQAHGARYDGKRIGGHGDMVAWSFYPTKNLGAMGDAGAVTTNNASLAEKVRRLRNYGTKARYVAEIPGYNSRLDSMQAAILRVKLEYLDEWNFRRTRTAHRYLTALDSSDRLILPTIHPKAESAWHLFVVRNGSRDELARALASRGIGTLIHYPIPPHMQKAYAGENWETGSFPIAKQLAEEVLSLPIGPHLTDEALERILSALYEKV